MFLAGLEPATFCVLGRRDNHYTTETVDVKRSEIIDIISMNESGADDFSLEYFVELSLPEIYVNCLPKRVN